VRQLKRVLKNMKGAVAVFVASESNLMITDLTDALKRMEVSSSFLHYKIQLTNISVLDFFFVICE
jgi:hypothetical protein